MSAATDRAFERRSDASALLNVLPRRDADEIRCRQLARALEAAGCDTWCAMGPALGPSICASVRLGAVRLDVAIEVRAWWAHTVGDTARLAFRDMDAIYLLALFARDIGTQQISTGGHVLTGWHAHAVEFSSEASWHVWIRTDNAWPFAIRTGSDELLAWAVSRMHVLQTWDALPMVVTLSVGRSRLTRRVLEQIEPGDVVLIHAVEWHARIGAQIVGSFCIEEEGWELNLFDGREPAAMRAQADATSAVSGHDIDSGEPTGAGPGWLDTLPVELEFVLDRVTLTVAELRSLVAGAVFPVRNTASGIEAAQGRYTVRLCANGRTMGEGELVAIGETLAVELIRFDLNE